MSEVVYTDDDLDEVIQWRIQELERAGFTTLTACALAIKPEVDLHQAVDLVKRGCDPQLAVQILI